jgi:hypothetical protein
MNTGDWITLAAVIVALGIGIASILHTQNLQKKERKERLLNEIIEWAEDIRKSSSQNILPNKVELDSPIMQIPVQQMFLQSWYRYQDLYKKSSFVKVAIFNTFRNDLFLLVLEVIQRLDEILEVLEGCISRKAEENSEKVEKYKETLDHCAEQLIIGATNLKTKNL